MYQKIDFSPLIQFYLGVKAKNLQSKPPKTTYEA
jgi:hypothetical protein